MNSSKFVVGTRFFEAKPEKAEAGLKKLQTFFSSSLAAGAESVYVAINEAVDTSGALAADWPENVHVFPVTPWGKFVLPLDAILLAARGRVAAGAGILLASAEVALSSRAVQTLMVHMDGNTLVTGAALVGHEYVSGYVGLGSGRQVPWNTLALWDGGALYKTGFPLVGDGVPGDETTAGVEEVAAIATIQALYGVESNRAKLVQVSGHSWDTSGFDGERLAAHEKKMASKTTRPAAQLEFSGLAAPTVMHI